MKLANKLIEKLQLSEIRRIVKTSNNSNRNFKSIKDLLDRLRVNIEEDEKSLLSNYLASGTVWLDKNTLYIFNDLFKDKQVAKDVHDATIKLAGPKPSFKTHVLPDIDDFTEEDGYMLHDNLVAEMIKSRPDGCPIDTIKEYAMEILLMNSMGDEYPSVGSFWIEQVSRDYPILDKVWDAFYKDNKEYINKT